MKKIKIKLSAVLISMCILMSAVGCQNSERELTEPQPIKASETKPSKDFPAPYDKSIFALDTFINLRLYSDDAENCAELASERITELENILSVTNENSDVSLLNENRGEPVEVDNDTFKVINTAIDVSSITDGALDISVYPIVKLWGFTTDEHKVPSRSDIEKELKKVDYTKIIADENDHTVQLAEDMQIDLGAVAKGYISEDVKNLLKENGIESAVLSFGGNIQTIGTKNGELWKVGVKYPFTEDSFAILSVEETAVVTSATDQRYFEEDGKRYHHIIDPKSGYPVDNGTFSTTVVCESGARADALSTSIFVMGIDNAKELYKNSDDFEFIILDEEDNVYVTSGLKDKFKLTDSYDYLNVEYVEK